MSESPQVFASASGLNEAHQNNTVRAVPRSGRGRPLTVYQQRVLVEVCRALAPGGGYAGMTKQFWRRVSDLLKNEIGRPYSWQSCRRQMIRLEHEITIDPPRSPLPTSSLQSQRLESPALRVPTSFDSDSGDSGDNDDDDDALPAIPLVRGELNPFDDGRKHSVLRDDMIDLLHNGLANFENQLRLYSAAIIENPDDLHRVRNAFVHFKDEMTRTVDKYRHRRERASQ